LWRVNLGKTPAVVSITGTCRSFDPQHTERYLASYEWRFNRRFDLEKNVELLACVAAQIAPASYQSIAAVRSLEENLGSQDDLWPVRLFEAIQRPGF
jgi:hypothetical protein